MASESTVVPKMNKYEQEVQFLNASFPDKNFWFEKIKDEVRFGLSHSNSGTCSFATEDETHEMWKTLAYSLDLGTYVETQEIDDKKMWRTIRIGPANESGFQPIAFVFADITLKEIFKKTLFTKAKTIYEFDYLLVQGFVDEKTFPLFFV